MNLNGKRIAVGGFLHETNTFQEQKTTYADFAEAGDRTPLTRGPDVLERFSGLYTSIARALQVLHTTRRMFDLTDAMVAYTTYPHVDMAETGLKAGHLLVEVLARGRRPEKTYRQVPYLIPLTWQCSTLEPSRSIYAAAARLIDHRVV